MTVVELIEKLINSQHRKLVLHRNYIQSMIVNAILPYAILLHEQHRRRKWTLVNLNEGSESLMLTGFELGPRWMWWVMELVDEVRRVQWKLQWNGREDWWWLVKKGHRKWWMERNVGLWLDQGFGHYGIILTELGCATCAAPVGC